MNCMSFFHGSFVLIRKNNYYMAILQAEKVFLLNKTELLPLFFSNYSYNFAIDKYTLTKL